MDSDGVSGIDSDMATGINLDVMIAIDLDRGTTRVAADNSGGRIERLYIENVLLLASAKNVYQRAICELCRNFHILHSSAVCAHCALL